MQNNTSSSETSATKSFLQRACNLLESVCRNIYERKSWLLYLIFSIVAVFIVDGSSPYRKWNPLPSASMFVLIGNGIFDGLVPYRDLWDGKGFLVFFIVGLFSKIFSSPYMGSWILSIICISISAIYYHKTASLFTQKTSVCYTSAILTTLLTLLGGKMYAMGGVSDVYIIPLMSIGMYNALKILIKESFDSRSVWAIGLCIASIFWMKFTSTAALGMICLGFTAILLKRRLYREAFKFCAILISSFLLISFPIITYYAVNGALGDLYYGYYLFHKQYHTTSLLILLYNSFGAILIFTPVVLLIFASLLLAYKQWRLSWKLVLMGLSLVMMWIATFIGSLFCYYLLPLMPFALLGIVFMLTCREMIRIAIMMFVGCGLLYSYDPYLNFSFQEGIYLSAREKSNLESILRIVEHSEDKGILHYGHMDCGLYNLLGIYPKEKYYQQVNYDPIGRREQERLLSSRVFKYVTILVHDPEYGSRAVLLKPLFTPVASRYRYSPSL